MPGYLQTFPNYQAAARIAEVDGFGLDVDVFRRRYTRFGTPVIIRGAARHWPACREWTPTVLEERILPVQDLLAKGGLLVSAPFPEYAGDEMLGHRADLRKRTPSASGREFTSRVRSGELLTAYGVDLSTPGLELLCSEIGSLPFLAKPLTIEPNDDGTGLHYVPRLFLHAGGYTDWHFHYADDTVTVQAQGDKEFLLVPPRKPWFQAMWHVARQRGFFELLDQDRDALGGASPLRGVLHAGDALYIPVFWWHAVEAVSTALGATLAFPFKASWRIQYDLSMPGPRWNLEQAWRRRYWHLLPPLALLGITSVLSKTLVRAS